MSAFDAVIETYWGSGETATEALNNAVARWCSEDDDWFDVGPERKWFVEVYEGALFETNDNPDHEGGFVLARWTRRGRAEITADGDDQPVLGDIVWMDP